MYFFVIMLMFNRQITVLKLEKYSVMIPVLFRGSLRASVCVLACIYLCFGMGLGTKKTFTGA